MYYSNYCMEVKKLIDPLNNVSFKKIPAYNVQGPLYLRMCNVYLPVPGYPTLFTSIHQHHGMNLEHYSRTPRCLYFGSSKSTLPEMCKANSQMNYNCIFTFKLNHILLNIKATLISYLFKITCL